MRRLAAIFGLVAALALVPGSALAARPVSNCPADSSGYFLVGQQVWWDLTVAGFEAEGVHVYVDGIPGQRLHRRLRRVLGGGRVRQRAGPARLRLDHPVDRDRQERRPDGLHEGPARIRRATPRTSSMGSTTPPADRHSHQRARRPSLGGGRCASPGPTAPRPGPRGPAVASASGASAGPRADRPGRSRRAAASSAWRPRGRWRSRCARTG